jgi:hypothetical protein
MSFIYTITDVRWIESLSSEVGLVNRSKERAKHHCSALEGALWPP